MKRDELGYAVWVVHYKLWGKIPFNNKGLKGEVWWRKRIEVLVNAPTIDIPKELLSNWEPTDRPIPFEVEMNYPSLSYKELKEVWDRLRLNDRITEKAIN